MDVWCSPLLGFLKAHHLVLDVWIYRPIYYLRANTIYRVIHGAVTCCKRHAKQKVPPPSPPPTLFFPNIHLLPFTGASSMTVGIERTVHESLMQKLFMEKQTITSGPMRFLLRTCLPSSISQICRRPEAATAARNTPWGSTARPRVCGTAFNFLSTCAYNTRIAISPPEPSAQPLVRVSRLSYFMLLQDIQKGGRGGGGRSRQIRCRVRPISTAGASEWVACMLKCSQITLTAPGLVPARFVPLHIYKLCKALSGWGRRTFNLCDALSPGEGGGGGGVP